MSNKLISDSEMNEKIKSFLAELYDFQCSDIIENHTDVELNNISELANYFTGMGQL